MFYCRTNRLNKGLISVDRNSKGYSTTYNTLFQHLSRLQRIYLAQYLELCFREQPERLVLPPERVSTLWLWNCTGSSIFAHVIKGKVIIVAF
jgi:hypothetical protein